MNLSRSLSAALVASTLLLGHATGQGVVSWNYDVFGTVSGTNVAGRIPVANWNNSWPSDLVTDLMDDQGTPTTVDISYSSAGSYRVQGSHPGVDGAGKFNRELLNGYLNSGSTTTPATSSVTLSEIPYAYYDLHVYFSSEVADRSGTVTDGTTTYSFRTLGTSSFIGTNVRMIETTDTGSGNPPANYAVFAGLSGASQTLTCDVPDGGGIAGFQIVEVEALTIVSPTDLATGAIGVEYSKALATVGGIAAYIWTLDSGALPDGLSLGPDGVLSGTPAAAGTFAFTARVTDGIASTATKEFTVRIVAPDASAPAHHAWALRPTMGWNSWDFYGVTITEYQARIQADYQARHLLPHGWDLFTVDIQWYAPDPITANGGNWYHGYQTPNDEVAMDEFGRLLPAETRFPSATGGAGFTALADDVHAMGMKFGIHIMRGIPRQAVIDDLPIKDSAYSAADIADTSRICEWNNDMYGIDMSQPGAQDYLDSLLELYTSWGVDFIKCDDLSRPYHQAEIDGYRQAIDHCGRQIAFSTSPGQTVVAKGAHIVDSANQWRITDDFWDHWWQLEEEVDLLHDWTPYRGPGYFPDADMLPFGKIEARGDNRDGRESDFTPDEHYFLMSLWAIVRSPLIHGGDMTQMDPFTLSLLTNDEVIAVNQFSSHNRQLYRNGDLVAWVADDELSSDKYLAVLNTGGSTASVPVDLADLGFTGSVRIRSLWDHADLGSFSDNFSPSILSHGGALYRVSLDSGTLLPTPWIVDATPTNGQVTIVWESLPAATSYRIKRADGASGTFSVVADNVTGTTFTDTGLVNGTVYHYAVSAMVSGQETPDSGARSVVPMAREAVSWNLNRWSDSPTRPTRTAGVFASPNWNDTFLNRLVSPADFLWDSNGELTPVTIAWASVGTYSIVGGSHFGEDTDGNLNREILNGYLNSGGGATSSVTLSNVNFTTYDVYVYFSSDVAGRQGTVTDGTTTYYFNTLGAPSVNGPSGNAVLVETSNTTTDDYSLAANYAVFSGLSGGTQTISVDIPDWGGIAAIQVVGDAIMPPADDFAAWIAGYPGVGAQTGFADDPDRDGLASGLENFFGTDPSVADVSGLTQTARSGNTFTFQHPQNAAPGSDVSAAYRWSLDLNSWSAGGASSNGTTVSFSASPDTPTAGITTVTATIAGPVPPELFADLVVTQSP